MVQMVHQELMVLVELMVLQELTVLQVRMGQAEQTDLQAQTEHQELTV